tara:strand:- start:35984 stop:36871 length:888 start_codon:yes stop_codon:yes gene_type:complete
MNIIEALRKMLKSRSSGLITEYELGRKVHELYRNKKYQGEALSLKKASADRAAYNRILRHLLSEETLSKNRGFPKHTLGITEARATNEIEIACTADPFSYISHHTALEYHGFAKPKLKQLYLTSLNPGAWRQAALQAMRQDLQFDLEAYLANNLPRLTRVKLDRVGKVQVHRFTPKEAGIQILAPDLSIRVATIGQTFLDILRHPEWSGGMKNVLRVFEEYAPHYVDQISEAVARAGTGIDKVRVGYLFDEHIKIQHPATESWVKFAQRGGSRKLDPMSDYQPIWSEKWCLSINV